MEECLLPAGEMVAVLVVVGFRLDRRMEEVRVAAVLSPSDETGADPEVLGMREVTLSQTEARSGMICEHRWIDGLKSSHCCDSALFPTRHDWSQDLQHCDPAVGQAELYMIHSCRAHRLQEELSLST